MVMMVMRQTYKYSYYITNYSCNNCSTSNNNYNYITTVYSSRGERSDSYGDLTINSPTILSEQSLNL